MEDATTAAVADLDNKIKAIEQRLAETTSEYQGVIQNSKCVSIEQSIYLLLFVGSTYKLSS
jgi:hypothetical protein